jgi:acyl carrier protein
MTTRDRLIGLIATHAGREPDTIGPLNTLVEDLDLDSLDRLDLRIAIEDTFSISMSDAETDDPELGTVGGLLAFVEDRVKLPLTLANTITPTSEKQAIDAMRAGWNADNVIDLMSPSGMSAIARLAQEGDNYAHRQLRRAYDAGFVAGQLDGIDREEGWETFKRMVLEL